MNRHDRDLWRDEHARAYWLRLERERSRQVKIDKKWHAILKVEAGKRHVHISHILNGLCRFYYGNVETIIDEMRKPTDDFASRDGPKQVDFGNEGGRVDSQPSK